MALPLRRGGGYRSEGLPSSPPGIEKGPPPASESLSITDELL